MAHCPNCNADSDGFKRLVDWKSGLFWGSPIGAIARAGLSAIDLANGWEIADAYLCRSCGVNIIKCGHCYEYSEMKQALSNNTVFYCQYCTKGSRVRKA